MTSTPDDAVLLKDRQTAVVRRERCRYVSPLHLKTIRCVTWMTWWIRVQTSVTDKSHRRKWPTRGTSTSRYRRISTLTVADESVAVLRQISPRTTETKALEHQHHQTQLSEGKNAVNIYLELDGLDDVTEDAFTAESGKTNVSLTIASVASRPPPPPEPSSHFP